MAVVVDRSVGTGGLVGEPCIGGSAGEELDVEAGRKVEAEVIGEVESNGDAFVEGDGPEGGRLVDEVAGGRGAVAESVLVLVAVEGVVETKVVEDALALPSPEEAVGEIFLASIAHGN